jgi:branched-chain amino acid transport system permease protein
MTATLPEVPVTDERDTSDAARPTPRAPGQLARIALLVALLLGACAGGQVAGLAGARHSLVPLPVQLQALALGGINALFALGLVLVYRSNRIINFAHASLGSAGAIAFLLFWREYHVPWGLALPAGLVVAGILGALVELLLIRRFSRSTRLVVTVVTIGIAQLIPALVTPLLDYLGAEPRNIYRPAQSPFSHFTWNWFPVVFSGDEVLLVAVTILVMAGLVIFFRSSHVGIAVRAAAENGDRANLLGVNTSTLAAVVWVLAAVLASLATILQLPITGLSSSASAGVGSPLFLPALAAAVLARFENLPLVVVSALSINVFQQSVYFVTGRYDISDLVLFVVILVGLLMQRQQLGRSQLGESGTWAATEEIRPVPPELVELPPVRKAARWFAGISALLLLGYPWVTDSGQVNTGSLFAIYGIVAVSLVILIGWGGQISLGQWGLAGVGAIVGGGLEARFHVPFPLALLVAGLVGAGVAILLGLPALRIRGLFLAVTTLAFSVVVSSVLFSERYFGWLLPTRIPRPKIIFLDTGDERAFYYICLAALAGCVVAALRLRRSRTGRVLIAMRDNERTAQAYGVNLVKTRLATFALSGFMAAVAGHLFAVQQSTIGPERFTPADSIQMFLMAVIGGLGSVTGVLLGPVYLGLITVFLNEYALLASAVGLLFVLLVLPGGFGSLAYAMRDSFLRRVAIRHKIFVPSLLADYSVDGQMSRAPMLPKLGLDREKVAVPVRYRLSSRIGATGSSQSVRRWTF